MPHATLIKFPGTNCDSETARALAAVGFSTAVLPVNQLTRACLDATQLVVLAGGFSYGDYVMAGRIAQLQLQSRLGESLASFHARGGYVLGICNGFQILARLGLLPPASLIDNSSRQFLCQWSGLRVHDRRSPFLTLLPDNFELPVAHAEGRFVTAGDLAASYLQQGLAPLTYSEDINGSSHRIAALQSPDGRVFGLMPHPERFTLPRHHYSRDWNGNPGFGWGHLFFLGLAHSLSRA